MSLSLKKLDPTHKLVLDFPDVRQSRNYTCGVSSLQAILYYYGVSFREDELETLLKADPQTGTHSDNIISVCREFGLKAIEKHQMTIDDLRFYLGRKIPVVVSFQAWQDHKYKRSYKNIWDSGHYAVIIGIIGDLIIIEDPSLIGRGIITTDEFLHRWHDKDEKGNRYINYGIAIYGKPVKYHSDKLIWIE